MQSKCCTQLPLAFFFVLWMWFWWLYLLNQHLLWQCSDDGSPEKNKRGTLVCVFVLYAVPYEVSPNSVWLFSLLEDCVNGHEVLDTELYYFFVFSVFNNVVSRQLYQFLLCNPYLFSCRLCTVAKLHKYCEWCDLRNIWMREPVFAYILDLTSITEGRLVCQAW